jgi:hypothetical protein
VVSEATSDARRSTSIVGSCRERNVEIAGCFVNSTRMVAVSKLKKAFQGHTLRGKDGHVARAPSAVHRLPGKEHALRWRP